MKFSIVTVLLLVSVVLIIGFYFFNRNLTNNNDGLLTIGACIRNLTDTYTNAQYSENDFMVGYEERDKEEVIDLIKAKGLAIDQRYVANSFLTVTTNNGEVIKQMCILLDDKTLMKKIQWIEPDFITTTAS